MPPGWPNACNSNATSTAIVCQWCGLASTISSCGLSQRRPIGTAAHTFRKFRRTRGDHSAAQQSRPQSSSGGPAGIAMIWSTHLHCAAFALFARRELCRQRFGRSLRTGLLRDGRSERPQEHHAVSRARDGPANNFSRARASPLAPAAHGAVRHSRAAVDGFRG